MSGMSADLAMKKAIAVSRKYTKDTVEGAGAIKGKDGKSAYQIAVEKGFVGTEEEWLASLQGEEGPEGPQGEKGDKGDKGDPGSGGVSFSYDEANTKLIITTY